MSALFLGLDLSTQALKATLLSGDLSVLAETEVRFDRDVSHYGTTGGTLQGPSGSGIVFSPIMMLVEAMDLLFDAIKLAKWPVHEIRGVSAAGQQHSSVYWSQDGPRILATIDPKASLASQLQKGFSRNEVPNWQDSSTLTECNQLEKAVGGPSTLAKLTGSRAHTRFTGPQIMRFMATQPKAYRETFRISLVSSFLTTLLCLDGEIKGIDESDACGMNMWNMNTPERGWDKSIFQAIAGRDGSKSLEEKMGRVETDGGRVVGHIGRWFVERYGFNQDCIVCPGTGDNPATFLFFSLRRNEALVSLGSSDVVLVSTSVYTPDLNYHAFFHPAQLVHPAHDKACQSSEEIRGYNEKESEMKYFNMLVYKNGSLAREYIRDRYFESSWESFNRAVEVSRPKDANDHLSQIGFYWLKPETIPSNVSGIHRYVSPEDVSTAKAERVPEFDLASTNAIAILESQMLNYRSRASAITGGAQLERVFATGGASSNSVICSVMADVFGCEVCKPVVYHEEEDEWNFVDWNVCSAGAAYKAAWSWYRHSAGEEQGQYISFDDFVQKCKEEKRQLKRSASIKKGVDLFEGDVAVLAQADEQRSKAYTKSIKRWATLEARAVQESRKSIT